MFIVIVLVFFCTQTVVSARSFSVEGLVVFGGLALLVLVLHRRLVLGLLDVLLVPVRRMDVIVDENAAAILIGSQRWYLFLDGITDLKKFRDDTWTVQHFNGTVLHVAASAIDDDQLAHIRAAIERGRTPEGVRAVIERGKRIQAVHETHRKT